jgi:hypothetical protein
MSSQRKEVRMSDESASGDESSHAPSGEPSVQ